MAESAIERAQRLLDLVPYLKSNPGITTAEVAKVFNVSKTDLLKDLNLLFLCGLPGYTHLELLDISFEDEVITVHDAQNLGTPRTLTDGESLTLRIALHALLDSLPSHHRDREKIVLLMKKLSSVLEKSVPRGSIEVSQSHDSSILATIESALVKNLQLEIVYVKKTDDTRTTREISPARIENTNQRPVLVAWCHKSNGLRTFLVSHIESITLSEKPSIRFSEDDREEPRIAPIRKFGSSDHLTRDFPEALDGHSSIRYFNEEWLIKVALSYGDEIEVLAPTDTRREIALRAQSALAQY